eukprot:2700667-Pleurochrysis_carterae.AAC.2
MAFITRGDAALNDHFAHVRVDVYNGAAASGAGVGMHCATNASLGVKGSIRPNSTLIATANGTMTLKYRCDVDNPLRTDLGVVMMNMMLKNVLVPDNASHNLISLGRLATAKHTRAHCATAHRRCTGSTRRQCTHRHIPCRNHSRQPRINQPSCKDGGAIIMHARFNHLRAEVIKLLPQCTRDAPDAWARLARNITYCEDCLSANSDAVHSNAHMPATTAVGDIISYDIYYVSVPHVHGGQQYEISFHDHY